MTTGNTLTNGAVLAELRISQWNAQLIDKSVADRVAREYRAGEHAGKYHKDLMAGSSFHAKIKKYAQGIRNYHIEHTIPWTDRGPRLCTLAVLPEYKATMTAMIRQLEVMIEEFLYDTTSPNFYETQKRLANQATVALGELYREADYPTLERVRTLYKVSLSFDPVPQAGDFRIDAVQGDLEFLRSQHAEAMDSRVRQVQEDIWGRLHKRLDMVRQKVVDMDKYYEAQANNEKLPRVLLQDDYLDTLRDMCGLLGKLNVTGDAKLDQARQDLLRTFEGVDNDDLKEDAGCRQQVAKQLEQINNDYFC